MNKLHLLTLLTGALGLTGGTDTLADRSKLGAWIDEYAPRLADAAVGIFVPPFSLDEAGKLAELTVRAAQTLQGIFAGMDRAKIAQTVFIEAARSALPDGMVEDTVVRMLESDNVAKLIEDAYQRLFGAGAPAEPAATTTEATLPEPTEEADPLAGTAAADL